MSGKLGIRTVRIIYVLGKFKLFGLTYSGGFRI